MTVEAVSRLDTKIKKEKEVFQKDVYIYYGIIIIYILSLRLSFFSVFLQQYRLGQEKPPHILFS